jgi:hypothetical protein
MHPYIPSRNDMDQCPGFSGTLGNATSGVAAPLLFELFDSVALIGVNLAR